MDEIGKGMFPGNIIPADPCESWLATNFSEELSAFLGFGSTPIYSTGE
jgi:hypothetical protein